MSIYQISSFTHIELCLKKIKGYSDFDKFLIKQVFYKMFNLHDSIS